LGMLLIVPLSALYFPPNLIWSQPHVLVLGIAAVTILFALGCYWCHRAGKILGKADHSAIVWDEMVAIFLVWLLMPDWQHLTTLLAEHWPLAMSPLMAIQSRFATFHWPVDVIALAVAFFSFRFFDIVKWPPANYFDEHWHHGVGVMTDDFFAAIHSLLLIWAIHALLKLA
jgi:phosphatidylglycerophosphatase A